MCLVAFRTLARNYLINFPQIKLLRYLLNRYRFYDRDGIDNISNGYRMTYSVTFKFIMQNVTFR